MRSSMKTILSPNTFMCTFVDDCYSVISGKKNEIWKKIENYISTVEKYYTANKLKLNTGKTQILILGKNNTTVNGSLLLDGTTVTNSQNIKILGTIFSQAGNWNANVSSGSNCFLTQLKCRANVVVRTAKNFDLKFKLQLFDSLLVGKIRYILPTWGNVNMKFKNKINNIMLNTVKKLTKNLYVGRTIKFIMRENKILDYFQLHSNACFKQTFSLLNNNDKNFASSLLAEARTIRNVSQNKCGPLIGDIGWTLFSQNTYLYRMKTQYNKLPRQLTLSPNFKLFKKWLQTYTFNKDTKLPDRKDNHTYYHLLDVDMDAVSRCTGSN